MRKEFGIGLMLCGAALTLQRIINVPEILMGVMLGAGLWMELYGIMSEETRQKIKKVKRNIFKVDRVE